MDEPKDPVNFSSLQELISETSDAKLESSVNICLRTLDQLKAALSTAAAVDEICQWTKSIDELRSQAYRERTVVGVVGSTGAGKSSLINAVLDEEFLVPTNCMRACTAVSTEISYNRSDNADEKYRAEIHFISGSEWIKELHLLLDDLRCGSGQLNPDYANSETETGIAYAKIRAVHPHLEKKDFLDASFTVDTLVEDTTVQKVLGTVLAISATTCKDFSERLEKYVDSRQKSRGKEKESKDLEYWPLIKVVKIFVKSSVLQSGLVLVDLPGIQDSNAARSAVVTKYIEQCTGLWVVAPITRAVDDKSAQTLLGKSFRRQLQFDGMYSNVTVICSKTDDISMTEVLRVVPEEDRTHQLQNQHQLAEAERNEIQAALCRIRAECVETMVRMASWGKEASGLRNAQDSMPADDGETVVLPAKRSAVLEDQSPQKRICTEGAENTAKDDLAETVPLEHTETQDDADKEDPPRGIAEIEEELKALREKGVELAQRERTLERNIKVAEAKLKKLTSEMKAACIRLDQDTAAEQDEDSFDPDDVQRDYAEVANQLPVFCISSKAYQKISGRLRRDEAISGFAALEDTEIPALKSHILGIVQSVRQATCRRSLTDVSNLLQKLYLQVVVHESMKLEDDLREMEMKFLEESINTLKSGTLVDRVPTFIDDIAKCLADAFARFALRMAKRPRLEKLRSFRVIDRQILNYKNTLRDTGSQKQLVRSEQQEARLGSFKRMKETMIQHVNQERVPMFEEVASSTKTALNKMLVKLHDKITQRTGGVISQVNDDYTALVSDRNIFKDLAKVRKEVGNILRQCDETCFQMVQNGEPAPGSEGSELTAADSVFEFVDFETSRHNRTTETVSFSEAIASNPKKEGN
ncbi:hypothetical protein NEMBOFW57_000838 [Staphylotrichum longicolle]|uniref:Dynamin N-terminal domain-containing protein n=1 Tax=Staphylotrichum longicolle TaxID=669026 RepID=A0AAD4F031_9PEZI|nr:hypothetical protein NEMBOFW57_000838 [Staphylotrichum longicolle]